MNALLLFAASFVLVFLLGLQQLNLEGRRQLAAFITSLGITATNLVLFKLLPGQTDWLQLAAHFVGGALGIVASMWAYPLLTALLAKPGWQATWTPLPDVPEPARTQRSRVWNDDDDAGVIRWKSPL